jgi:hypothetical protein
MEELAPLPSQLVSLKGGFQPELVLRGKPESVILLARLRGRLAVPGQQAFGQTEPPSLIRLRRLLPEGIREGELGLSAFFPRREMADEEQRFSLPKC